MVEVLDKKLAVAIIGGSQQTKSVLSDIVLGCALSTDSPEEDFHFAWTCIGWSPWGRSCEARGYLSNSSSLQFPKHFLSPGQFVFAVEVTPRKQSSNAPQVASSVVTIDVKGTQVPEVAIEIDTSKTVVVDTQVPGVFGQVNANDKIVIVGELKPPPSILPLPPNPNPKTNSNPNLIGKVGGSTFDKIRFRWTSTVDFDALDVTVAPLGVEGLNFVLNRDILMIGSVRDRVGVLS